MKPINSTQRIRIYIFLAFISVGGVLYFAYRTMQMNVDHLVQTVRESADPDLNLVRLKGIWSGIQSAESDVRSFTVTSNQVYLDQFNMRKDSLRQAMNTLMKGMLSPGSDSIPILKLDSLVIRKLSIYDRLLELSYSRILSGALSGLGNTELVPDSLETVTDQGTVMQRLFSSRYSRKAIKAKTDSLIQERNNLVRAHNSNLMKIRDEEALQLKVLRSSELALLDADRVITSEIESLISTLEAQELINIKQRAATSEEQAESAASGIRNLVIIGLLVVLLLFILVLRDIDASNKRKKELIAARNRAEKLARAKEEFMSTMSHEIRTPLTSIIGFAGKLKDTTLDTSQQQYSNAITGSSEHLLAIVNDVLDFTRVESGKLTFDQQQFNVSRIFGEVHEALLWKAEEKGIRLILQIPQLSNLTLKGDPVRLRQVLFNIIGNAIKFTDTGSVTIQAVLKGTEENVILEIRVTDTGIGIPPDRQKAIFEEFVQAERDTEQRYGGSGLGLAITRRIVEQQGGTIAVESVSGKGSEFTINIPFIRTFPEADQSPEKPVSSVPPLEDLTIILAEDDEMIRELQFETLKRLGANVILAEDGNAAVRVFEKNAADLLLMDIRMPGMSGPEAVRVIRTGFLPPKRDVPVIIMTANVIRQEERDEWMREGINEFISKPFREEELLVKINALLNSETNVKASEPESVNGTPVDHEKQSLYDLTDLVRASNGNPEFVKKMTGLFMTTAFASLTNLKFYQKQQNWEQLEKTAHRMLGSYKQMGVADAAIKLKQLEEIAATSKDPGIASGLVTEVERISLEVFEALKQTN